MGRIKFFATVALACFLVLTLSGGEAAAGIKIKSSGSDDYTSTWAHSGGANFEPITSVTVNSALRKCFYIVANATQGAIGESGCNWGISVDDPNPPPNSVTERWSNQPSSNGAIKTVTVSTARKLKGKHTIYFLGWGGPNCSLWHYHLTVIGPMGGNCPKPDLPTLPGGLEGLNFPQ